MFVVLTSIDVEVPPFLFLPSKLRLFPTPLPVRCLDETGLEDTGRDDPGLE